MCDPVLGLTIASAAVTMAGQYQQGSYASQVAKNQAATADANKGLMRAQVGDAIGTGQDDQRKLGRQIAERVGSQEARMAAGNTDITYGSAARVTDDTLMIGREDSDTLADNTRKQVAAMQTDIWNYESQKRAAIAEGKQAKTAALFGMASTALGSATQYAKFKAA